jgi:hypothetical protein
LTFRARIRAQRRHTAKCCNRLAGNCTSIRGTAAGGRQPFELDITGNNAPLPALRQSPPLPSILP